jgi:hypothetical protein
MRTRRSTHGGTEQADTAGATALRQLPDSLLVEIARLQLSSSPRGHQQVWAGPYRDELHNNYAGAVAAVASEVVGRRPPTAEWLGPGPGATPVEQLRLHTEEQLRVVRTLRSVCKQWRAAIGYELVSYLQLRRRRLERDNTLPATTRLPAGVATRFAGCERVHVEGGIPDALRWMSNLRVLEVTGYNAQYKLPDWIKDTSLTALWLDTWFDTDYRRHDYGQQQLSDVLPITLQSLRLNNTGPSPLPAFRDFPDCLRPFTQLTELDLGGSVSIESFTALAGLYDLPLRRLSQYVGLDPVDCARFASTIGLEALLLECEGNIASDALVDAALSQLFVGTPLAQSIRELALSGCELKEVPASLRGLVLTRLDLQDNFKLSTLPDWVGEMPLVALDVVNTGVSALPRSFRHNTTLRVVVLYYSGLCIDMDEGADFLEDANGTAEESYFLEEGMVDRLKAELLPLSLSQPLIRFKLLNLETDSLPEGSVMHPGWDGWWHAGISLDQFVRDRYSPGENMDPNDARCSEYM